MPVGLIKIESFVMKIENSKKNPILLLWWNQKGSDKYPFFKAHIYDEKKKEEV